MSEKHPILTFGVRENRTLDYTVVETYLASIDMYTRPSQAGYAIMEHEGKWWVEFTIDNGATDLMVRIPAELIADMHKNIQDKQAGIAPQPDQLL